MTGRSHDPTRSSSLVVSDDAAFRRIADELRTDASPRAQAAYDLAFWDLVWALPVWHLLVRVDERRYTAAPSFVEARLRDGGQTGAVACMFTSAERASAATRPEFLPLQPEGRAVLSLSRERACDALCASGRISGLCVNPDDLESSRELPLHEIAAAYERRFGQLTPRMFGRFAEAANRGGAVMRDRLVRRLLDSPEWWFVGTESRRQAPALVAIGRDRFVVPLFTIGEWARRAGDALVRPLSEGDAITFPLAPREGVGYLRRLHERERMSATAVIVNDVPGEAGEPAAIPIDELLRAAETLGW